MKTLSNPEKAFAYHLYGSGEDGLVTFVLSVPIAQLDAFISYADHRKKIYTSPARVFDPLAVEKRENEYEQYCKYVLGFYDACIKKGLTRNQSISESNKLMKDKSFYCTYERTKNIVLKHRRLKK